MVEFNIIKEVKVDLPGTVKAVGDLVARFGNFAVDNVKAVLSKFVREKPGYKDDNMLTMLTTSESALRVIQDSQFASTDTLQEIRARIIAQEYEHPNGISRRAAEEMLKISGQEFEYFEENVAPFCSEDGIIFYPCIFSFDLGKMRKALITMNVIHSVVEDVNFGNCVAECEAQGVVKKKFLTSHFAITLSIKAMTLRDMCATQLNQIGMDLCKICKPKPLNPEILAKTKEEFLKLGLKEGEDFTFEQRKIPHQL